MTLVDGGAHRHFGVYPAVVRSILDPERLGRVEVSFPWLGDDGDQVRAWATLCSPYADDDQGLQVMPEVESQVVVAFEAGQLQRPYVIGACWNGVAAPPETPTRPNDRRVLKTRSGSRLEFDDADAGAKITVSTEAGHKVVLDALANEITVAHPGGASIVIDSIGAVRIDTPSTVDVTASTLNVHAPVANFDGIINCTTAICSVGVVSPSYTPGAGNVW